jgi:hypothetical protein
MQIEYESDWMSPTIELIKCLGEMNQPKFNEEMGSIDYIVNEGHKKKLIRVMVDEKQKTTPVYVDTIRAIIIELEEKKYDEALILSKRITDSAHEIVALQENLHVITPNMKNIFSLVEVLSAIQKKTSDLCILKCGKAPETKEDCTGKTGRNYSCDIRRISDDATFHAKMKWKDVLIEDFYNLCEVEKNMEVN